VINNFVILNEDDDDDDEFVLIQCIYTARRYASAIYAVDVCPSVRLSITSPYCIETTGRIKLSHTVF